MYPSNAFVAFFTSREEKEKSQRWDSDSVGIRRTMASKVDRKAVEGETRAIVLIET